MDENRIVILPSDLVDKLDLNRGEMGRADFVKLLLERLLQDNGTKDSVTNIVTRQELQDFQSDIRALLRTFLDFFIAYGLELGPSPKGDGLQTLTQQLQDSVGPPEKVDKASPG